MRYISKSSMLAISNSRVLFCAIALLALSACAGADQPHVTNADVEKYDADTLAKDWREQVRKNNANPYENYNYPSDNDSDYRAPKQFVKRNPNRTYQNQQGTSRIAPEDDDANYGKFPRYNPDDDNTYNDPKNYPLYMDQ